MKNTIEAIKRRIAAQKKLCDDRGWVMYAPADGYCFKCNRQIYEFIDDDEAGTRLITGCPICHRTFCD